LIAGVNFPVINKLICKKLTSKFHGNSKFISSLPQHIDTKYPFTSSVQSQLMEAMPGTLLRAVGEGAGV
jgi:hypothetical protein